MKKIFTIVLLVFCVVLGWAQTAVFVASDGNDNNNGSSWSAAKKTIAAGITAAGGNGTVYVMVGQYAISAQLVIPSGVSVKGGYSLASSGTDTTKRELPGTNNRWENASVCTIISGAGNHRIAAVSGLLEGCVVRWGYHSLQGGGALIDGGTVRYCVIRECDAYNENTLAAEGGGAYILNGGTLTNSVVTECRADKGPAVSGGNGSLINNTITRNYPTHCGTVADYDGNVYPTVVIGQQCWTKQNIRTTHYNDGTAIPFGTDTSTTQPYYYVNYAGVSPQTLENYGYLYNWHAAMHGASSSNSSPSGVTGICPLGWHVPSDAEWTEMTDFVNSIARYRCNGYDAQIAKSLSSKTGWTSSNNSCEVGNNQEGNNATLFSAYPAGYYWNNGFSNFGIFDLFWSSTINDEIYNDETYIWSRRKYNNNTGVERIGYDKACGLSVRCVKQLSNTAPVVHTIPIPNYNIQSTQAILGGSCSDGGSPISEYGLCWDTLPNLDVSGNHIILGSGEAVFAYTLTGLINNTTYYVRAYAMNSGDVYYGEEISFTTDDCGDPNNVTDNDGNTYNSVRIGTQCWMKENLRTTHYADGTEIVFGGNTSYYSQARYYRPNNNNNLVATYGLLYNYGAVIHGSSGSNTNPSGVQGVCPTGWHVPSKAEFSQLINYISSQSNYLCDGTYYAKSLASKTGWSSYTGTCAVGNNPNSNNATGFNAYPSGYYYGYNTNGSFWDTGTTYYFATSTVETISGYYYWQCLFCNSSYSNCDYYETTSLGNGYSVRCVRDE